MPDFPIKFQKQFFISCSGNPTLTIESYVRACIIPQNGDCIKVNGETFLVTSRHVFDDSIKLFGMPTTLYNFETAEEALEHYIALGWEGMVTKR